MIRQAVAFALFLALVACEPSEQSKKSEAMTREIKAKMDAEASFLKDTARAGPELEQRLMASIHVQDGILLVRDPITEQFLSYVLPANSPWVLSCGVGLSIVFDNSVELHFADGRIDQKDCAVLGPRLGKRLKAILQDDQSKP